MSRDEIHVVKLGGSLLDLPDLASRFTLWRKAQPSSRMLLLVGGGDVVDMVRAWDHQFSLRKEQAHWLAVAGMQLNARLVAQVLPDVQIVDSESACAATWDQGKLALADPLTWLEQQHRTGNTTLQDWSFTSDSIAAWFATLLHAPRLTLLKSTLPPPPCDVAMAVAQDVVDEAFESASANVTSIELVNLRATPPQQCMLKSPA